MATQVAGLAVRRRAAEGRIERVLRVRSRREESAGIARRFGVLGAALVLATGALGNLDPEAFPSLNLVRVACAAAGVAIGLHAWFRRGTEP